MPVNSWLKHLRTMRSAAKMGYFFPSQQPSQEAPLGSFEIPTSGSIWKRMQQEVAWFRISTHIFPFSGIKKHIRILHLTDIHIRDQSVWLDKLCSFVQSLEADLIVYTGDIITRGWTKRALDQFFAVAPTGRLGSYAVMGNWEYWSDAPPQKWRNTLKEYGVQLLVEESIDLEDFTLFGSDDHLAGQSTPAHWNFSSRPHIALTHSPAYFPQLCRPPIQLVLSGHAHGGQIRIPFLKALWVPKGTDHYVAGWFSQKGHHLFVSRGLGWSVAPLRFLCAPEAAYIDLIPVSLKNSIDDTNMLT